MEMGWREGKTGGRGKLETWGQLEDTFTNTGEKSGLGWRGRTDMGNQQWLTILKY